MPGRAGRGLTARGFQCPPARCRSPRRRTPLRELGDASLQPATPPRRAGRRPSRPGARPPPASPGPVPARVTGVHPGLRRPWPTCNPSAQSGHGAAGAAAAAAAGRARRPSRGDAAPHLPRLRRRAPPSRCRGSALGVLACAAATGVAGPARESVRGLGLFLFVPFFFFF